MRLTKNYKAWYYRKALALAQSDYFRIYGLCYGLCSVLQAVCDNSEIVTPEEVNAMLKDFQNSKPSYWKPRTWRFLRHPTYTGRTFWWHIDEIEQRIKFLKYLIKKNS